QAVPRRDHRGPPGRRDQRRARAAPQRPPLMPRLDPIDVADIKASVRKAGEKRLQAAAAILAGLLAQGRPGNVETMDHALDLADQLISRNITRTVQDIEWALTDAERHLTRDPARRV